MSLLFLIAAVGITAAMTSRKLHFGIYTSSAEWSALMGSTYTGGSAFSLWYSDLDGQPVRPRPCDLLSIAMVLPWRLP